jgi:hypothetical protein
MILSQNKQTKLHTHEKKKKKKKNYTKEGKDKYNYETIEYINF